MAFAPDGRLFVTEQGGTLRVVKNGVRLTTPFLTVSVNSSGERGLLGLAFDPEFSTNRFIYVYYTTSASPIHNRVSRFTADATNPDIAQVGSELVLMDLESGDNHNGGAMKFGVDGKLYIAVGENGDANNSQTLNNRLGKVLRINADGSIPTDNPFYNTATGVNRSIWALGLRNPFTFDIQPGTGRIHINDVGGASWEEINLGVAGGNYGWPTTEGETTNPNFISPIYAYPHSGGSVTGCAIVGAAFYNPPVNQFPASYSGDYFFGDYCSQWIKVYDIATDTVSDFASNTAEEVVDVETGPDGALYYATSGDGRVYRIQYGPTEPPALTLHPTNQSVGVGQTATFSVSASGTPPLSYQWQRNGSNISGATHATYTTPPTTLSDNGATFRCVVTNQFGNATSNPATLTVTNNQPPTGSIVTPPVGSHYNAGDTLNFSGTATDPEDGTLPASAYTWVVELHHDAHTHPGITITGQTSGSYTVPALGHTETNVFYRITLTVTDAGGLHHTTFRDVLPNLSQIRLQTNPASGPRLNLDGQPLTPPLTVDSVVGVLRNLEAPSPQVMGTTKYVFQTWSDGGAQTHDVSTPATPTTYTATFNEIPAPTLISPTGTVNTSLTPPYRWNAVAGATAYGIAVFDLTNGQLVVNQTYFPSVCTAGVCAVTPSTPLQTNRFYAWYAATQKTDWGVWSNGLLFLASIPPAAPTILSPTGNYLPNPQTLTPHYSWTHASGSILYYLAVFNLQTGALQFAQVFDYSANPSMCTGGTCTVTPTAPGATLTNGGSYGAFVAGLSYGGAGPWSQGVAFNIFVTPAAPTMVEPTGAQPSQPTYRWTKVIGADNYYITVLNAGGTPVFGQWVSSAAACAATPCQLQQPTPLPVGNYSVFGLSSNLAGMSGYGPGLAFNVTASPPSGQEATPAPAPTFRP